MDKKVVAHCGPLSVYNYILNNLRLPTATLPRRTLNRHVSLLKNAKLIHKVGYGTWEVNNNSPDFDISNALDTYIRDKSIGQNTTRHVTHNPLVRSHAFIFTCRIPKLKNWEKREEYLQKNNIQYTNGPKIYIQGRKVYLYNKSIVIYDKSDYIAQSATQGKNFAIAKMIELIGSIERILNCSFKINSKYLFKVSRQHHSLLKNELARQYRLDNKKLYIYDSKGYWMWIDFSDGIDELETGNRQDSDKHLGSIQLFFEGLRSIEGFTPQFVTNSFGIYAENLKSHIAAVQNLGTGVNELRTEIAKIHLVIEKVLKNAENTK